MNKRIIMTAPEVDLYKERYHSRSLNSDNTALTEEGIRSLNSLLQTIEKIKPTYPDKRWEFWFSVPRGNLNQYIKYNKYCERDEQTEEEFKKDRDDEFPNKRTWFKIGVINEDGYVMVLLDDSILVQRDSKKEGDFFPDTSLTRILDFYNQVVLKTVRMLEKGTYNDYVEKGLPYENRKGFIKRSLYWKLVPKSKKFDRDGLEEKELKEFVKYVKSSGGESIAETINPLKHMTSDRYYEICSFCYIAARYEELEGKTSKEMFKRYGDDRDGGMSLLNGNSEDDFDKWYALSSEEKWKIENPTHMWEMSSGSSHTRIHLFLRKGRKGYWFQLSGGTHCRTTEIIRMYNVLKEKGIPVFLSNAKEIMNKILGEDNLGIVPNNEQPWHYWYGSFLKDDILNFVQLQDGNASEVIKNATWFKIKKIELMDESPFQF